MRLLRAALILWLVTGFAARASADDSLSPGYVDSLARTAQVTEQRLERTLLGLPDVVAARVHLTLVDESRAPLDTPRPKPRLSLWLSLSGKGPSDADLRALLVSAAPRLEPADIHIARHEQSLPAKAARASWVSVGPFRVAPDSAWGLRLLLATCLTVIGLLSGIVVWRAPRSG